MRLERRWPIAALAALILGSLGAQRYAQLTAPCYRAAAALIARGRPWTITGVEVTHERGPGTFLRLHGEVRRTPTDAEPAARLTTRAQVGAVVEGPLVFWTLLLLWPATSVRSRLVNLACGLPVFLALETATTVCQLLSGFAEASALLAGDRNPLTDWERWSRFIDSGGREVLAVCGVLLALAWRPAQAAAARCTTASGTAERMPTAEPVRH